MSTVLVIAEKPSVAKSIAKVLGANNNETGYMEGHGYIVSYCFGHLCEYAMPEVYDEAYGKWNRDSLPIMPEKWRLTVSKDKKEQFEVLKGLLNRDDIEYVVNACDAGREGELIFYFVYKLSKSRIPAKRLWISSMEEEAILSGFEHLKDASEYKGLCDAAVARSKADWLVGINGTRLFTTLYKGPTLKVGRVQSPTLAMIAERDEAIRNFKPEPFYTIKLKTVEFTASTDRFSDKNAAEAAYKLCENSKAFVTKVSAEDKKSQAPKLYDLTSLQRDANRMYGISAKDTLDALQNLYEKKLATYPRTDSRYLTDDMAETAENVLFAIFDTMLTEDITGFIHDTRPILNSKKVSDHHAIIPTVEIKKQDITKLPAMEQKIFYLIAFRLVESVAPAFEYTATKAEITICDLVFKASGRIVRNIGYKRYEEILRNIFNYSEDSKDDEDTGVLPELKEGQEIADYKLSLDKGMTKPPLRYTEDTLLSAMEHAGNKETVDDAERKGIGTPATRADIIEKLIHDGYVKREKKKLTATDLGVKVVAIMPENIKSPILTAEWENNLTKIAKGDAYAEEFVYAIEKMVQDLVDTHTEPDPGMAAYFREYRQKQYKGTKTMYKKKRR